MPIPQPLACDALVFGSHAGAMALALTLARQEQRVVLATTATCLYEEQRASGDFRMPREIPAQWQELYPQALCEDGLLHPDRLKRHGEALMAKSGVQLLYACDLLGCQDGYALLSHKSGPYAVACHAVYDCRQAERQPRDGYCLHIMQDGGHQQLILPAQEIADDPHAQHRRYESALNALPESASLARSGMSACCTEGFAPAETIARCLSLLPMQTGYQPATEQLTFRNPVLQRYPLTELPLPSPETDDCDVLVVGGGTAGAAAAFSSARMGLKTRLIDMNGMLGGSATVGGVSTYWFGLRGGATAMIDQAVADCCRTHHLPRKAGLWCEDDVFFPDVKAHVLLGLCLEAGVDVRFGCIACAVEQHGQRVTGAYYTWQGRAMLTRARMILDCTGDGDLCMMAGAAHTYGNAQDGMTYWGSLAHYPTPDRYRNNFSTMVHLGDPLDYTRFIIAGRTIGEGMYDHGQYVAVRESRHIHGMATLTLDDILTMKPVTDPLYVCFSNYDPKGRLTAEQCYFGLLPPNQLIPIPRGCVIPVDETARPIEGLLVGGKAISCTHDAFPGVRMQPDLQQQGMALAALTACSLEQDVQPWEAEGVGEKLRLHGAPLPEAPVMAPADLEQVISSLTGDEPWDWLDDPVTVYAREVSPIVRVMTAPTGKALALLRNAFAKAEAPQLRLMLARLLLWHGAEDGAPLVLDAVRAALAAAEDLPRREGSVNYGQMLPDHGLMPEAVYLLNSLSHAPSINLVPVMADILSRIERSDRNWRDLRAGIYCYCESFAWLAVRRRDAALAPLIQRLLELPEFQQESTDPLLSERLQMLRLALLHALHTLGVFQGTEGLRRCTHDSRLTLVLSAERLLHDT